MNLYPRQPKFPPQVTPVTDKSQFRPFPPSGIPNLTVSGVDAHFGEIREVPDPRIDGAHVLCEEDLETVDEGVDSAVRTPREPHFVSRTLDLVEFAGWMCILVGALLLLFSLSYLLTD